MKIPCIADIHCLGVSLRLSPDITLSGPVSERGVAHRNIGPFLEAGDVIGELTRCNVRVVA